MSRNPGLGKSALAVHWAHLLGGRYSDGQLYVNLRGFDPSGAVMSPADAVRGFLDALGVAPERIPGTVDAQVGLYRSMLAGKRVLVLLDNARDAEQIRPMLPGAPGCLVVVTSRNQMPSLVAVDGAHTLTLDVLTIAEGRQLLLRRVGRTPVAAEPRAVEEVIDHCARLPLALVIAAARATARPDVSFANLAAELREARSGLDAFDGGDSVSDVRTVFSWSYRTLGADAARLFRLLGLHPGPDVSTAAAASLAALPVDRVRRLLEELTRAHLLAETTHGRFAFHDLLRAYANERARGNETEAEQRAVLHRLLDHYLFSAFNATVLLDAHRHRISLSTLVPGVGPEEFTGSEDALAWFVAEHAVLLAAVRQAADKAFDSHVWQMVWTVATFFARQGHWSDWATTARAALTAAQRAGGFIDQARAHQSLASAYAFLGRHDDADQHFRQAIDTFAAIGDLIGEAHARRNLTWLLEQQGRYADALHHREQTRDLFQAVGDPVASARAINGIGWYQAHLGDHEQALVNCQEALAAFRDLGDRSGQAATYDSFGYIHQLLGRPVEAVSCYEQAIGMYQEMGIRHSEATTLEHLGDLHLETGNHSAARRAWRRAIAIFDELEGPYAERVATKLDGLAAER